LEIKDLPSIARLSYREESRVEPDEEQERAVAMKSIILKAGTVLVGTMAYVLIGVALAGAG
jgi:hypothetical protein